MARPRNYWNIDTMNQYCIENNNKYKILDIKREFVSGKKHMYAYVKCDNEKHEPYWILWHLFIKGVRCNQCYYETNNKYKWDYDTVISLYKQYGLKIIDITQWNNVDKSIECEDNIGFKYNKSITKLKQKKTNLSIFHKGNPFSLYNLKLYCYLYRPDYELLSDTYIDIKTEYLWKYIGDKLPKNEDRIFNLTADCFIHGNCGHPYFSFKSKGAIILENLLMKNNIEFKKEKTFKGCKDKKLLRFDFYLPQLNKVIEVDGLQHTIFVELWGNIDGLKDRQRKDEIKNKYCENNNIKLIRIPYDGNKLEEFIKYTDNIILELKIAS
jgi:very-short-patch-repair endonuclease